MTPAERVVLQRLDADLYAHCVRPVRLARGDEDADVRATIAGAFDTMRGLVADAAEKLRKAASPQPSATYLGGNGARMGGVR